MKVKKYNPGTREYSDCEIPDEWEACTFSTEMGQVIGCAQCGRKIMYGNGYTSLEIHNDIGFGFIVCPTCYDKEWDRRKEFINRKEKR